MKTALAIPLIHVFLEATPDATVIIERDGTIAYANPHAEALFGYAQGELTGRPIETLVPERFHGVHKAHRDGYFEAPRRRPMGGAGVALFARKSDGTEFPAEISLSPLTLEHGTYTFAAIRDVTAHKQAEEALRRARDSARAMSDELQSFGSSVAHDLRAPLRSIRGFSEILLRDYTDKLDSRGQGFLKRIDAAADRMGMLIEALLSLSRVTQTELKRERISLSKIAEAVVAQLHAAQPDRSVQIVIAPDLSAVGDAQLLRAALDNLLGNAWKFTGKRADARVEVGGRVEQGAMVFFVRDNGAGFDMKDAEKLFAPFQRLHAASAFPGTGIGLATVQRIIHRHGGRIWAEGATGNGATFFFTIPSSGIEDAS